MGKFDGILICTDCDGTLTGTDGVLSAKNAEAIQYFQREGGIFTLATGRFPGHILNFSTQLKVNAPVITLNGVLLYDLEEKRALCNLSMKKEDCTEVLEYVKQNHRKIGEYWFNYGEDVSICYRPEEDSYENHKNLKKMIGEMPEKIGKVVFVMPEDILGTVRKDLREKFGDRFRFDASWPNGLEMQWTKSSKGIAVEILKKHLGGIKKTICIGDYDNDISMLKVADVGYAVSNATDEVKKAARRITVSNDENAIAAVIEEIESCFCR